MEILFHATPTHDVKLSRKAWRTPCDNKSRVIGERGCEGILN